MSEMIVQQARIFLISMLYGGMLGIWYEFFRVLRKRIAHRNSAVHMEDIVFCLTAAAGLFLLFQICNQGMVRSYVLAGIFAGALLYFLFLSTFISKGMAWALGALVVLCKAAAGILFFPFKIIVKSLAKSLKKIIITVKIIKSRK